jgi:hypothetical protein
MSRHDGHHALLIEAGDQVGDHIAGAAASRLGCSSVGLPGSNREERFVARATWVAGSLCERLRRLSAACSSALSGRSGSFGQRVILSSQHHP